MNPEMSWQDYSPLYCSWIEIWVSQGRSNDVMSFSGHGWFLCDLSGGLVGVFFSFLIDFPVKTGRGIRS